MSILNVGHLSRGFGDRVIFHDVSFRPLKGEYTNLIGVNGEGKSMFMNIITDKLMPDEGKVGWAKSVRVGYLDQHMALEKGMTVRDMLKGVFAFLFEVEEQTNCTCDNMGNISEEEMNVMTGELGTIQDLLMTYDLYIIGSKVGEMSRALGLNSIGIDKDVIELSGDQRTKVLLGKLLLQKPGILLLDKPTSYLDTMHIEWLKRYLQEYKNTFIPISHNIPFLNSVINLIHHTENQSPNRYVGDRGKFQEACVAKKAQLEAVYKRQQREISELEDFVARDKARMATKNMAMFRQRKLDKMDVVELAREKPKPEFHFLNTYTAGKYILETTDLIIGYDEPLSRPLNLVMKRGQKVMLVDANGAGKTTLLESILGIILTSSGDVELGDYLFIGYSEQEMVPGNTSTCLEEIWKEFPSYIQYQVRSALAKCRPTTKYIESQVRALSDEEQAKVRLCKLIDGESNVLFLDEPANHLDADVKEELKRALKGYKGGIPLICHEPEFYEGPTTDVWDCKEWILRLS